jgi:hypothetical protein
MLFYIGLVIVILAVIGVSIFLPAYRSFVGDIRETGIFVNATESFRMLLRGDFEHYADNYEALEASYNASVELIEQNIDRLYIFYIIAIVLGVLGKLLISFSYVPFVDVVNKFMHSDINEKFAPNLVANGKTAIKYALFDLLIIMPLDTAIFFIIFFVFKVTAPALNIFVMPFIVAFGMALYMLRVNMTAGWIPAIVYENISVTKALAYTFKSFKQRLVRTYTTYFMLGIFSFSAYMLFGLSTLGLGYIIGIPMLLLLYRVLELVTYYNLSGHRYYLDHETIATPRP